MRAAVLGYSLLVLTGTAALAQAPQKIPLRAGLTIVKAVEMTLGDAELIVRVERLDATAVHLKWSGDITPNEGAGGLESIANPLGGLLPGLSSPASQPATKSGKNETVRLSGTRAVRRADLANARHYYSFFAAKQRPEYPGSTSLGASTAVLADLKESGQSEFSCMCDPELFSGVGAMANAISRMMAAPGSKESDETGKLAGTIKRVEAAAVPFPVLVNNVAVTVPAIHARGKLGGEDAEFWFLDDEQNSLALKAQVGPNKSQVVKISFPGDEPAAGIAVALAEKGRADVYGIYFDFGSATIRAESEPVLKEIADAMTTNPAWKLNVEGHTDDVGEADENLELSRKRSAAVKQALVSRYRVDGARLATQGFGETRPKEKNDTMAGRARNRRVELVRR